MPQYSCYAIGTDIQNLLPTFEFTLEEARETLQIYGDKEAKIFKIDIKEIE